MQEADLELSTLQGYSLLQPHTMDGYVQATAIASLHYAVAAVASHATNSVGSALGTLYWLARDLELARFWMLGLARSMNSSLNPPPHQIFAARAGRFCDFVCCM